MSNHKARLSKLEKRRQPAALPVWAELLGDGRAVLRYQDGQRVEAAEADIPRGVKCYRGWTPDNWSSFTPRPVNYRAGIVPGVEAPIDEIKVKFVESSQADPGKPFLTIEATDEQP